MYLAGALKLHAHCAQVIGQLLLLPRLTPVLQNLRVQKQSKGEMATAHTWNCIGVTADRVQCYTKVCWYCSWNATGPTGSLTGISNQTVAVWPYRYWLKWVMSARSR